MTDKEREERRDREKKDAILAHSLAKQATEIEGTTYEKAIRILEKAKTILIRSMENQKAEVPSEIRDNWGIVIGMSEASASDKR